MKMWHVYGSGLVALAGFLSRADAQSFPGVPSPTPPPPLPGAVPAAPAPQTLWGFLGLGKDQKAACKQAICQSQCGLLLNNTLAPARFLSGGLIPPLCPGLPTAAELADKGPVGAAAAIKKSEAEAKARRAAVRYLGTVNCQRFPAAKDALIAALREDPNECVRWEAAMALGSGCCCAKETIKALAIVVSGSNEDGKPPEESERVRSSAEAALYHCLDCFKEIVPVPKKAIGTEGPGSRERVPPPNSSNGGSKSSDKTTQAESIDLEIQLATYYRQFQTKPSDEIIADARRVLAEARKSSPGVSPIPPGSRGLMDIIAFAADAPHSTATSTPLVTEAPAAPSQPKPAKAVPALKVPDPPTDLLHVLMERHKARSQAQHAAEEAKDTTKPVEERISTLPATSPVANAPGSPAFLANAPGSPAFLANAPSSPNFPPEVHGKSEASQKENNATAFPAAATAPSPSPYTVNSTNVPAAPPSASNTFRSPYGSEPITPPPQPAPPHSQRTPYVSVDADAPLPPAPTPPCPTASPYGGEPGWRAAPAAPASNPGPSPYVSEPTNGSTPQPVVPAPTQSPYVGSAPSDAPSTSAPKPLSPYGQTFPRPTIDLPAPTPHTPINVQPVEPAPVVAQEKPHPGPMPVVEPAKSAQPTPLVPAKADEKPSVTITHREEAPKALDPDPVAPPLSRSTFKPPLGTAVERFQVAVPAKEAHEPVKPTIPVIVDESLKPVRPLLIDNVAIPARPAIANIQPQSESKSTYAPANEPVPATYTKPPVTPAYPVVNPLPSSVQGLPSATELLNTLRTSYNPFQREWAAEKLAIVPWMEPNDVVSSLMKTAHTDSAAAVRVQCVRTLAQRNVNTQAAIALIRTLRADADPRVQHEVDVALVRLGVNRPTLPANSFQPPTITFPGRSD